MLGSLPQAASPLLCCCVSRALSSPEKWELQKNEGMGGADTDTQSGLELEHSLRSHTCTSQALGSLILFFTVTAP